MAQDSAAEPVTVNIPMTAPKANHKASFSGEIPTLQYACNWINFLDFDQFT
jgi:hypothetical protein